MTPLSSIGASLAPSFITPLEETWLLENALVELSSASARLAERSRVLRFGCNYNGHFKVPPIPSWLDSTIERLPARPDFITLNEYLPGDLIAPHFDALEFGDPIMVLGLKSACEFEFSHQGKRLSFEFPARALLCMRGPSRWPWEHAVKPVKQTRYSLVFRSLKSPQPLKATPPLTEPVSQAAPRTF